MCHIPFYKPEAILLCFSPYLQQYGPIKCWGGDEVFRMFVPAAAANHNRRPKVLSTLCSGVKANTKLAISNADFFATRAWKWLIFVLFESSSTNLYVSYLLCCSLECKYKIIAWIWRKIDQNGAKIALFIFLLTFTLEILWVQFLFGGILYVIL